MLRVPSRAQYGLSKPSISRAIVSSSQRTGLSLMKLSNSYTTNLFSSRVLRANTPLLRTSRRYFSDDKVPPPPIPSDGADGGPPPSLPGKLPDSTELSNLPLPASVAAFSRDVEAIPRLNYPMVVPLVTFSKKPLFPGITGVSGPMTAELDKVVRANYEKNNPFVGCFLLKEVPSGDLPLSGNISKLDEVYEVGVLARVIQKRGSDGFQLKGLQRIAISLPVSVRPGAFEVAITPLTDEPYDPLDREVQDSCKQIWDGLRVIAERDPKYRESISTALETWDQSPAGLCDIVLSWVMAEPKQFQDILETLDVKKRLHKITLLVQAEVEKLNAQVRIVKSIEEKLMKNQQRYYLMENMKMISKELGLDPKGDKEQLVQKFQERLKGLKIPKETMQVINEEISKLQMQEPHSSEYNVTRQYLEILTTLPWGIYVKENFDLNHAYQVLTEDHYGLKDVKDRILEFIAVGKRKGFMKGKILCFVGPPGVGKTSIGKSIARALGRYFYRFAVGGLYDISEIKGHRRTYIGSFPGKIINALRLGKSANPVIMIDEIDKLRIGNHGDPAAALLEVLDPEQNSNFIDHYLDVPFDLSKVLFLCTANVTDTIPQPLLDRMEVVRLSGYIHEEKFEIAKRYLIPTQMDNAGLKPEELQITDSALNYLITWYSREAGVRKLSQYIDKICRKVTRKAEQDGLKTMVITQENLEEFIGKPQFTQDKLYEYTPVGVIMGLSTGSMGGSLTYIETVLDKTAKGDAHLRTTGHLGEVLKESTAIAYTVAKAFYEQLKPGDKFFETAHFHIHLPEGATPKDGPSAGIGIVSSLLSVALNRPIKQRVAMTGEITITGRVLPIGGVKDKTIAAKRAGVTEIILPIDNKKDFEELDEVIKKDLTVHYVTWYRDVYDAIFAHDPANPPTPPAPELGPAASAEATPTVAEN